MERLVSFFPASGGQLSGMPRWLRATAAKASGQQRGRRALGSSQLLLLLPCLVALLSAVGQGPCLASANVNITWTDVARMPYAVGETSAGIVHGSNGEPLLIVMGWNPGDPAACNATMVLDINANKWSVRAQRPLVGHHMAAVSAFNKLYLIGGYLAGTTSSIQIYDPVTDTWSQGAKLPVDYRGAAGAAVVIGDIIYYCGGVERGDTSRNGKPTNRCTRYNITANTWTTRNVMANMTHAVHHASMATDGELVYVFGGRNSTGGTGLDPVNHTQIYNPKFNNWTSSSMPNGPLAMASGRGGMGAAVFYKDYFYVIGGEVRCGLSWYGNCPNPAHNLTSLGVFNRVDRYNHVTNTWDKGLPGMSMARHGQYPVVGPAPNSTELVVYVCAGGEKQSFSEDTICTYMSLQPPPP
ncbi:hypothetical protein PLESTB_001434100 [Pleodorina starrii]|uniref:Kelch repeat-containing protein n=1 Tax=Pleodorina starrii TaxID=330485 RepID=A0A9W6F7C9_9CHLO|nr:hypothetical protein PLESTB_001434100 [Pleodorina starrii]GLC67625.1 hypothetical protein PLESTF_000584200 [Pleodorina starrii]